MWNDKNENQSKENTYVANIIVASDAKDISEN